MPQIDENDLKEMLSQEISRAVASALARVGHQKPTDARPNADSGPQAAAAPSGHNRGQARVYEDGDLQRRMASGPASRPSVNAIPASQLQQLHGTGPRLPPGAFRSTGSAPKARSKGQKGDRKVSDDARMESSSLDSKERNIQPKKTDIIRMGYSGQVMLIPDESVLAMIKTKEDLNCLYDVCERRGLKRILTTLLKTDTDEQIRDKVSISYQTNDAEAADKDILDDYGSVLKVYDFGFASPTRLSDGLCRWNTGNKKMSGADVAVCAAATIKSRDQVYIFIRGRRDLVFKTWFKERCAEAAGGGADDERSQGESCQGSDVSNDDGYPTQDPVPSGTSQTYERWGRTGHSTAGDVKPFASDYEDYSGIQFPPSPPFEVKPHFPNRVDRLKAPVNNTFEDPIVISGSDSDPEPADGPAAPRGPQETAKNTEEQKDRKEHPLVEPSPKGEGNDHETPATDSDHASTKGKHATTKRKRRARPVRRPSLSPVPPSKIGAPRKTRNSQATDQ